jgi:quercetin dioxygenase-like cupin family protein
MSDVLQDLAVTRPAADLGGRAATSADLEGDRHFLQVSAKIEAYSGTEGASNIHNYCLYPGITRGPPVHNSIRRVVTEHNDKGLAVIRSDESIAVNAVPGFNVGSAVLWTTESVPADNCDDVEGEKRPAGLTLKGGSVARISSLAPGFTSPMHRTLSIDYGIVLSGQVELILDGGETKFLSSGDLVVQRGTNHVWRNPSKTQWCNIIFVMIEAHPVKIGNIELTETVLP